MWASPGAYVGDVQAQMWARLFSTVSESCVLCLWMAASCNDACAMKHHVLHRCILQTRCMALRHCAERPARGFVRCGVDCVGSARQAFYSASAFSQNIGNWNTVSVTTLGGAFTDVGLADCIKRSVYDNWGSTLRTAYPFWSSLCSPSPTPRCEGRSAAWRKSRRCASHGFGVCIQPDCGAEHSDTKHGHTKVLQSFGPSACLSLRSHACDSHALRRVGREPMLCG